MTRNELNLTNELNFLRSAIASLKSTRNCEIANETRILVNAVNNVKLAQIAAPNSCINIRAADLIGAAMDAMRAARERAA